MVDDSRFDRYLTYADMTALLHEMAAAAPDLVSLTSLGQSYEGREIWLATVTNHETGPADEKPALLIDGNIHSLEMASSAAALFHIAWLIFRYGKDANVTTCLDTRAFYVVPRINPDGAERALQAKPQLLRSSARPFPKRAEPEPSGLHVQDIDGDGRILSMRLIDPNGAWKVSEADARLMIRRTPIESDGVYYRVLPEGLITGDDPHATHPPANTLTLDLNRNWPADWARQHYPIAGPFPLSEPETYALARFIADHPNIGSWICGHTFSGVLLRPGYGEPDADLPPPDLAFYKLAGDEGTRFTGYPALSAFHSYQLNASDLKQGTTKWGYDNFGIYTWVVEYWGPHRAAGVEVEDPLGWMADHPVADDLRMLEWNDRALGGRGFEPWRPFDHPQLGPVEIGGWDNLYAIGNPPPTWLRREIEPFPPWFVWQLLASPLLRVQSTNVTGLGDERWSVKATVVNTGYLPSWCSQKARDLGVVQGLSAELIAPSGVRLVQCQAFQRLGQLGGRAGKHSTVLGATRTDGGGERLRLQWILEAPEGTPIDIVFRHDRAGVARAQIQCTEGDT